MKILILILLCGLSLFGSVGKISALNGKVIIDRQNQLLEGILGFDLEEKDLVMTDDKSKAQLTLNDGTVLSLGKNSKLDINEYVFDEKDSSNSKANFKFAEGTFKSITGAIGKVSPEKFKLETKSASIGIRGTIVVGSQEKVACTQGEITVTSAGVTQVLGAGMMTNTEQGKPPTQPKKIEGNLLKEVDGDASDRNENSESSTSQSNETTEENNSEQNSSTEKNTVTESTNNSQNSSVSNISTFSDTVTNAVNEKLINEKIEKKIEENKSDKIVTISNNSFYSVSRTITEGQSVGSVEFNVTSEGTVVTIATYAPTNGMDPVLILLKKNEDGSTYSFISRNDDGWIKSGKDYNSILNYTLQKGEYKISVADFPFNTNEAENEKNNGTKDLGEIQLYFTSTKPLTFDDETIIGYSYNPEKNNISYVQKPSKNSIISISPVVLDTIISNNAQFGILADSKVGTTISIKDYGVFVTISDLFDLSNLSDNNQDMPSNPDISPSSGNVFLNTEEIKDGSSWGYWTSDFTNLSSVRDFKSTWVSGNQVTPSTNYRAYFSGQVIGGVTNGSNTGYIILNSDNQFNATIDLGAAAITKSLIRFNDSLGNSWNGSFDANGTANVNPQGFSPNITGTVSFGESIPSSVTGSLSGKYFGTNGNVQSIGGEFSMTNGEITATGNFKARETE